jgi:hypothetical protein
MLYPNFVVLVVFGTTIFEILQQCNHAINKSVPRDERPYILDIIGFSLVIGCLHEDQQIGKAVGALLPRKCELGALGVEGTLAACFVFLNGEACPQCLG